MRTAAAAVVAALVSCSQAAPYPIGGAGGAPLPGVGDNGGVGPSGNGTGASNPSQPGSPPPPPPPAPPPPPPPGPSLDAGARSDDGMAPTPEAGPPPSDPGATGTDAAAGPDSGRNDSGPDGATGDAGSTLLAECVTEINAIRSQNGLTSYTRAADLEAYAAKAVASDARAEQVDAYFNQNGGGGVSSAEDELAGTYFDTTGAPQQVLQQGLQQEEQGGLDGNANLLGTQWSQVGCGVATAPDGSTWIAIEYR